MAADPAPAIRRKPRIRSVLLAVNLLLLALPLGGLWMLRIYESALVRQTETELVAQGAVIAAAFHAGWVQQAGPEAEARLALLPVVPPPEGWAPRFATLDLARDPVLPAPPEAALPGFPADGHARAAGATLAPVLAEAQRVTLAAMRVTDRAGIVVASSGGERGLSLAELEEVRAALAGTPASRLRRRESLAPAGLASVSRAAPFRVFVALPVRAGPHVIGAVLLSRTPSSIGQALYGKRWELAGLGLALVLAAAALAGFAGFTVGRPIRAVAEQAKAVAAGARVPMQRTRRSAVREADELFAAIASMAGTLERRADYIGHFAAEVSHEFKTPLAALRGALELLQDHAATMTPEERAGFLAQAAADVERLDRLVRRLLELARAEAPHALAPETADIAAVAEVAAAPFIAQGLAITRQGPRAVAAMAPETLRGVLAILFENVRQHAGPGARCDLSWAPSAGQVSLRVGDTGRGITAANAPRIFDRFFTTARDSGGTGLGLSIARSHVETAGGGLRLLPGTAGAVFEIRLPAAGPEVAPPV